MMSKFLKYDVEIWARLEWLKKVPVAQSYEHDKELGGFFKMGGGRGVCSKWRQHRDLQRNLQHFFYMVRVEQNAKKNNSLL